MAAKTGTTTTASMQVEAREIDFVTRFAHNWQSLLDIIGVTNPVERAPGTKLVSKYAEMTLGEGDVAEGEEIPYTEAKVKTKEYSTIKVEKYAKAVTIEAINDYGREAAIELTDDQFLAELQNRTINKFYDYIQTGTLKSTEADFQMALAMAQGRVISRWEEMNRGFTQIVGFCNTIDAYKYIGAAEISTQTEFGMTYIENFLGYSKLFLTQRIPQGTIVATPVENILLYYTNPANSDFMSSDLQYTVDGATNLIGFHVQGDYDTATSKTYAIMGLTLFSEYLDGIAVITFGSSGAGDSADLASLAIGNLTLSPAFSAGQTTYAATATAASNKVTAKAAYADATIEIKNGGTAIENGGSATWNSGSNSLTVKVTNDDVTKTYTVTVTK